MTRRPAFPKLNLSRLPSPEVVNMPVDAEYKPPRDYPLPVLIGIHNNLKKTLRCTSLNFDPDPKILILGKYNNSKIDNDGISYRQVIEQSKDWKLLHFDLAHLLIKTTAIERIVQEYEQLKHSKKAETQLVNFNLKDFATHQFIYDLDYFIMNLEVLKNLPRSIRLAIWQSFTPDYLENNSNVGWKRESISRALYWELNDLLTDYPKEGFDIALKLLPLLHDRCVSALTLSQYLNSRYCVPYVISRFNTNSCRAAAQKFIHNFPDTFFNEFVYLLFTKPDKDVDKQVHSDGKKFLQWLLNNPNDSQKNDAQGNLDYMVEFEKALKRFDKQLEKPKLSEFFAGYKDTHRQILAEKQAKKKAVANLEMKDVEEVQTNDDGVPIALLSTDWQKQTRKRKFELNETIYQQLAMVGGKLSSAGGDVPITQIASELLVLKDSGEHPDESACEQLLLMLKLSTLDKPIPALFEVLPAFTEDSLAMLAEELWIGSMSGMVQMGGIYGKCGITKFDADKKWFITAQAWLADDTLGDKVWQLIKDFESDPYSRSTLKHSFAVLGTQASTYPNSKRGDAALSMLLKISQKARSSLRPHAEKALTEYAERMGITFDELALRLIPDFGLDKRRQRIVDYNPNDPESRKLTVSLTPEFKFVYQDHTGKTYKSPPKAGKNDDGDVVTAFLKQHKADKKKLRETVSNLPQTLETMMVTQQRKSFSEFMTYFVQHPIVTQLTQQVLWQLHVTGVDKNSDKKDENDSPTYFIVSESLELLDENDEPLTDKETHSEEALKTATVSIAHPVNLSEQALATWRKVFADYELKPAFAQLSRPVYTLTDEEKSAGLITRFENVRFVKGSLLGLTHPSKGWDVISYSGGECDGYTKVLNGATMTIELVERYPLYGGVGDNIEGVRIQPIAISKSMDAVTISELLYTVDGLARFQG